jgi:hydrogenase expression/formation protein HypC
MCLAVPAEVISIIGRKATISVEGALREVNLSLVDGVGVGDFVLVHAGFAIHRWDYEDVLEWRALQEQLLVDEPGETEVAP